MMRTDGTQCRLYAVSLFRAISVLHKVCFEQWDLTFDSATSRLLVRSKRRRRLSLYIYLSPRIVGFGGRPRVEQGADSIRYSTSRVLQVAFKGLMTRW